MLSGSTYIIAAGVDPDFWSGERPETYKSHPNLSSQTQYQTEGILDSFPPSRTNVVILDLGRQILQWEHL